MPHPRMDFFTDVQTWLTGVTNAADRVDLFRRHGYRENETDAINIMKGDEEPVEQDTLSPAVEERKLPVEITAVCIGKTADVDVETLSDQIEERMADFYEGHKVKIKDIMQTKTEFYQDDGDGDTPIAANTLTFEITYRRTY